MILPFGMIHVLLNRLDQHVPIKTFKEGATEENGRPCIYIYLIGDRYNSGKHN